VPPGHLDEGGKRRAEHEGRRRSLGCERDRHGRSERLSEVDDALGVHAPLEPAPRGAGIFEEAGLVRAAGVSAVAPIVEQEHGKPFPREGLGEPCAVRPVSRVSIEDEDCRPFVLLASGGKIPGSEGDSIGGFEGDRFGPLENLLDRGDAAPEGLIDEAALKGPGEKDDDRPGPRHCRDDPQERFASHRQSGPVFSRLGPGRDQSPSAMKG